MRGVCFAAASVACVTAFTAPQFMGTQLTQTRAASKATVSMAVSDMLGADVETRGVWDPLGFSKDEASLFRRRAVELKHGRICMLATLGYFVGELWHPLYDGKIPGGLKAIGQVPAAGWLQIIAAIGIIELTIGKQDYENKGPGEIGEFGQAFNPFADDAEKFAALQLKELKNGRLAQVGIMGMLIQEGLTGQTTLEQLSSGHISPFNDGQGFF